MVDIGQGIWTGETAVPPSILLADYQNFADVVAGEEKFD